MNGKFKFTGKILIKSAIFVWSVLGGLAINADAGTIVKTFDFGAGGDNPTFRSHSRTFAPPENAAIVVAVNYRTTGDGAISIIVEIEDAVNKTWALQEIAAEKTAKRTGMNIAAADNLIHGCEKSWQVRVFACQRRVCRCVAGSRPAQL